jgi:hypothetical protein
MGARSAKRSSRTPWARASNCDRQHHSEFLGDRTVFNRLRRPPFARELYVFAVGRARTGTRVRGGVGPAAIAISTFRSCPSIGRISLTAGWIIPYFCMAFVRSSRRGSPKKGSRLSVTRSIVERSTTGADAVDEVETGWTERQARGVARTSWTKSNTLPR